MTTNMMEEAMEAMNSSDEAMKKKVLGLDTSTEDPVKKDVDMDKGMEAQCGANVLSPLSGAYLLVVLGEPMSQEHKDRMMAMLKEGKYNNRIVLFVYFCISMATIVPPNVCVNCGCHWVWPWLSGDWSIIDST